VHDQVEVVGRAEVDDLVVQPAQLDGLPLQGAQCHGVELGPHRLGQFVIQPGGGPAQHLAGHHREAVTDVDGRGSTVGGGQGGPAAAHQAAVGDVVVHQKRVVQQLDRHGDADQVGGVGAEHPPGGLAQRRAQPLARPRRVLPHRRVQPPRRFAVGQRVEHGAPDVAGHLAQPVLDTRDEFGVGETGHDAATVRATGSHTSGWPSICRTPR